MTILEKILGVILFVANLSFWGFLIFRAIRKEVRNARGYEAMEADRKAKGQPFLGIYEEELEKEKYGIDD